MNELIEVKIENYQGENIVSSRTIAEQLSKEHYDVIKKIRDILEVGEYLERDFIYNHGKNTAKEYLLDKDKLGIYLNSLRNTKIPDNLSNFANMKIKHTRTRFETSFLDELEEQLEVFEIEGIRQYSVLNYRIDFYIKELNIAIEYDEQQHKIQEEADAKRQNEIIKELNCNFIRLDYQNSNAKNCALVLKSIFGGINKWR